MAEKKIEEDPLPEAQASKSTNTTQEMPPGLLPDKVAMDPQPEDTTNDPLPARQMADEAAKDSARPLPEKVAVEPSPAGPLPDKATIFPIPTGALPNKITMVPLPAPTVPVVSRTPIPMFMKDPPNDLYRRMLPAVLFVLTFVTVMTTLLVYMDKNALGAQQFRLNMSRDYELSRIGQASAPLVAYVRQLHLAPRRAHARASRPASPPPGPTRQLRELDRLLGELYNGTFVEFLPRGDRVATTEYLETARGWDGVVVRASVVDYYGLRGEAKNLHACLSPTDHPREISYQELENQESVFNSRVLCLPLYTVLAAAGATRAHFVLLGGPSVLAALAHLPFAEVHLQVIEVRSTDPDYRNRTTNFLATKNYTVAATFDESIMYSLKV